MQGLLGKSTEGKKSWIAKVGASVERSQQWQRARQECVGNQITKKDMNLTIYRLSIYWSIYLSNLSIHYISILCLFTEFHFSKIGSYHQLRLALNLQFWLLAYKTPYVWYFQTELSRVSNWKRKGTMMDLGGDF